MPRRSAAERAPVEMERIALSPEKAKPTSSLKEVSKRSARTERTPLVNKNLEAINKYKALIEEGEAKMNEINADTSLSTEQRNKKYEMQMKKQAQNEKNIADTSKSLLEKHRAQLDEGTIAGLEANLEGAPALEPKTARGKELKTLADRDIAEVEAKNSEKELDFAIDVVEPEAEPIVLTKKTKRSKAAKMSRKDIDTAVEAQQGIDIDVSDLDAAPIDVTVAEPEQATREFANESADARISEIESTLADYGLKADALDEAATSAEKLTVADKEIDRLATEIKEITPMRVLGADNSKSRKGPSEIANVRRERIRLQNEMREHAKRLTELGLKKPQERAEEVAALLKERADLRSTQDGLQEETLRDIEGRGEAASKVEDEFFNAPEGVEARIMDELEPEGSYESMKAEYQQTYKEWEELRASLANADAIKGEESGLEPLPTWEEFYAADVPQPAGFMQKLKRAFFPPIPPRVTMWNKMMKAREMLVSGAAGASEGAKKRMAKSKRKATETKAQF